MFDIDADILAPMMDAGVFGENVQPTYMPAAGGSFPIDGVFDNAYLGMIADADGFPDWQTVNPVLGVRLSQFPSPPVANDKVQVASVAKTYIVNTVKADGHGWAKLELTLAT